MLDQQPQVRYSLFNADLSSFTMARAMIRRTPAGFIKILALPRAPA